MKINKESAIKVLKSRIIGFLRMLSGYDIHYGSVEIWETKSSFVIRTYNGGWSENEYVDNKLRQKYRRYLILDDHPVCIYTIKKGAHFLLIKKHIEVLLLPTEIQEAFRTNEHYKGERKMFVHKYEVE